MLRLMKLFMYALIGYALYEFYQGMMSEPEAQSGREGQGGAEGRFSGGGRGREEVTSEAGGASTRRRVGRGVSRSA